VSGRPTEPDGLADSVRRQRQRQQRWQREGEPSMARFVGQIGVLGWIIVARRLLLAWYLRILRSSDIEPAPEDAIVTYPLA